MEIRKELGRNETLLSIEKARRVLGYEPAAHVARRRVIVRESAAFNIRCSMLNVRCSAVRNG